MTPPRFADPPTRDTLADAQRSLDLTRTNVIALTDKIDAAETALAQIVRDSRFTIEEMLKEKRALEERVSHTLAYLSPMRRLPLELLRETFLWCFKNHPCSAWVLASVCTSWRRLALRIPIIWSKIRLLTSQHASADTIRLWLERSGDAVPLDIEIFLRISRPKVPPSEVSTSRVYRRTTGLIAPSWPPYGSHHHVSSPYFLPHTTVAPPASNVAFIIPPSPPGPQFEISERPVHAVSRASMHWGHIAFFYLVEQMHRWERFVFRFDKQFASMGALKSITGDAPLLREFEVSSIEAGFFAEWPWLPNTSSLSTPVSLPNLHTLTLQHTPFKWSSPMLRSLQTLNLRALPTSHLPLDRILAIISNNPSLRNLSLHFQGVLPAVLPLAPLALPHLSSLSLGGHYHLTTLLDNLVLPNLSSLTIDIEARDPIEDVISSLLLRSSRPPLEHLAIAYSAPAVHSAGVAAAFYYGPGGMIITWSQLLAELPELKSLRVGGTTLEPLLSALAPPDEDALTGLNPGLHQPPLLHPNGVNPGGPGGGGGSSNQGGWIWACPRLEMLGLRSCHTHAEGVTKLVQMVEGRNPATTTTMASSSGAAASSSSSFSSTIGGIVTPVRLRRLELHDCPNFGEDVMKWLEMRIADVVCSEPVVERSAVGHHPYL